MAIFNAPSCCRFLSVALVVVGAAVACLQSAKGATPRRQATPTAVYAAFTLNLTRFVSWPEDAFASATAPLIIGTFPRDPINPDLDKAVIGETLDQRPIETIRIKSLDDLGRCHLVFMSRGISQESAILQRCAARPILTVSDAPDFLVRGGHVRFVPQAPSTRLELSTANLKASRLEVRAQLLRIAAVP